MTAVYHLELRQFPHTARVFNLQRAELDARFVRPWVQGAMIEHEERRWAPERTKLKVLHGPTVRLDELGLGRGWGQATKDSVDVTGEVVAEAERGAQARPEVETLKEEVVARAGEPIDLRAVFALAGAAHPQWRASEQLSVAEQAVWELLHQERVAMVSDEAEIPRERWQETVLQFSSWAPAADSVAIRLRAIHGGNGRG
ncbi:MAG TPA: hypothetical protein VHW04_11615 [Solirubrobacteraceae bacterium]|jgi:hypothetical protein|nr:hypothetical protein [Solirubrobacteraceae bacterium]